jgi:hypothetical protein
MISTSKFPFAVWGSMLKSIRDKSIKNQISQKDMVRSTRSLKLKKILKTDIYQKRSQLIPVIKKRILRGISLRKGTTLIN